MKAHYRFSLPFVGAGLILFMTGPGIPAEPKKPAAKPAKESASLPMGTISSEAWLAAKTTPLLAGEIDRLVAKDLKKSDLQPAPLISDELFLRRVWLDLTGRLPMPADIKDFLADKTPKKRAKMIDRLLDTNDYAKHWAQYWQEVITSRQSDFRGRLLTRHFQNWLSEQFKKNTSWGEITRAMVTASGKVIFSEPDKNGQAFLMASRLGADADTELAAETSRIFLGIQIQCAQCHDHPSDVWKRQQFHEFAAYFARLKTRPYRDKGKKMLAGLNLFSAPFGEHRMPSKDDPKSGSVIPPRFLDGQSPGMRLGDLERRKSLANSITSKTTPWFAAAYVNRIWGELMGQAFYQPIDDMGPQKEAVMPDVLVRVAGAFRGSDYNIKELFRAIMSSETYQRQIRPGESSEDHLLFASINPRRMDANTLWQALQDTLGKMGPPPGKFRPKGPFAQFQGLEGMFKQEFQFDPSTRPEEVEGSIAQALLLMNNPQLNNRIQAKGTNLLARILKTYSNDDEALRILYQRALSRRPTTRELHRCREHIRTAASRPEGFEDILWALINSTEFQTKR
jgi:hypothetical protein